MSQIWYTVALYMDGCLQIFIRDAVEKDPVFPSLSCQTVNASVDTPKLNGKKTPLIAMALIQKLFYSILHTEDIFLLKNQKWQSEE